MEEIGSDFSDVEMTDEEAGNVVLESAHETESEQSESSDFEFHDRAKTFYGKNGFKWSSVQPDGSVEVPKHNIVKLPGLKCQMQKIDEIEPVSFWNYIFTDEMVNIIVKWTNVKLEKSRLQYKNSVRTEFRDCDALEIKAFLGLLIYTAVFKSNHENIKSLFSTDGTGRDIFRTVMSMRRFEALLLCIRFDDPNDREDRRKSDKAAAVQDLLSLFNKNSQNSFSLGTCVTVDEMLVSFRGKCEFKVFMPMKPVKYGLKMQCLTDAINNYVYNVYLYSGKNSDCIGLTAEEKKYSIPTQSVLHLCKPIYGSNRNVTADNWYSSVELVKALKEKDLTFVGTLRKSKREIPPNFLPSKSQDVGSTLYGFTKDMTLISHVPKRGKSVILISSMHHSKENNADTGKPEIIDFYNMTKDSVECLDKKCAVYSSSRRTSSWAMAIFYRICDMSTINSYILYQAYKDKKPMKRLDFMKILAKQLVEPQLKRRLYNTRLPRQLQLSIEAVLGVKSQRITASNKLPRNKRKCCYLCTSTKRRKTAFLCVNCTRPVCLQCSEQLCLECANKGSE